MAKEQIGSHRFSPQVTEAPGRYRPAGISEASCIARRGLSCPWPAGGWEAVLPARLPRTGSPVRRPDDTPQEPDLLCTCGEWICPGAETRDCSLNGEVEAQVARAAGTETFREANCQPPALAGSIRCQTTGFTFLVGFKC